jgi:hypothetical protein
MPGPYAKQHHVMVKIHLDGNQWGPWWEEPDRGRSGIRLYGQRSHGGSHEADGVLPPELGGIRRAAVLAGEINHTQRFC